MKMQNFRRRQHVQHRAATIGVMVIALLLLGSLIPFGAALGQDGSPPTSGDSVASPDAVDAAASTIFTYQGNLKKSGQAVNANCSFQFSLWDALTGGTQKATTQIVNNTQVQAGSFTVQLDFGNQFTGDARWLKTEVQCAGDGGYTTLAPRQPLNAVPYAIGLRPGAVMQSSAAGDAFYVEKNAVNSTAIHGKSTQTGGTGIFGESVSWAGVWGQSTGASGVVGISSGEFSGGVYGENTGKGYGVYGKATNSAGVFGDSTTWIGVYGRSANQTGVVGESSSHDGVRGTTTAANHIGVKGVANAAGSVGVWGESTANTGIYGQSGASAGVAIWGINTNNGTAIRGEVQGLGGGYAVQGVGHGATIGVYGVSDWEEGVYGKSDIGTGVYGEGGLGVRGLTTSTSKGGAGIYGEASGQARAGFFFGDVVVTGTISKGAGAFQIDHPLDPANKYLSHSFVESPDMMNIYNGNITTNENGEAMISFPDWFEVLNRDFRYQLTPIGQFAQVIVAEEVAGNRFTIKTDRPNVKVSWQVTGIRHDPYAEANRIQVETNKSADERSFYLHPEVYGQPQEMGVTYQLHARSTRERSEQGGASQ